MIRHKPTNPAWLASCIALALAGCGSDGGGDAATASTGTPSTLATTPSTTSGPSTTSTTTRTVSVDATAGGFGAAATDPKNKYTYFSFTTGAVVELTDAAAASSKDWHIAFKRTNIKLNGGVSGPGSVRGAVADEQKDYYNADGTTPNASVFLNATAAQELASFDAVKSDTGLNYRSDRQLPYVTSDGGTNSWWTYDPTTHTVSANPNNWYIVRGAAGDSYAKLHVTGVVQVNRTISVELFIQDPGQTAFSTTATTWTAAIGAAGGSRCFDFETRAEVDCTATAATWDVQLEVTSDGRTWNLWSNSGIKGSGGKGGSFGAITTANIGTYVSSTAVPNFFADSLSGIFAEKNWYAYNLQGRNELWPNYRVYVIDTGTSKYKLQILSYYNEAGTSGHYKFRYAPL